MTEERPTEIEMIPIDQIVVVNPRARGKIKFKQIVDNIANLGLKKPITVTPRRNRSGNPQQYDLVCGQGRLEAFQALGQREVPAFVVNASKDEVMLMSLAENLARRVRSTPELMAGIATLKDEGYSHAEIADKTGLTATYVQGMLRLLSKGEERLLRAVEMLQIPISIAVTIATSDDATVQRALADAYTENSLRGKDLLRARRLIDQRHARGKRIGSAPRRGAPINGEAVLRVYKQETTRQRVVVRQARQCETKLQFVLASIRQLLADEAFVAVLRKEKLDKLPQTLAEQVKSDGKVS
ncbi:MAG: ParB N-terminal domain-containing protein [Planctomycetes bacterium]|nr:ParB N-terminal domain-containing protein [Planctomycetota bacterium]